MGDSSERLLLIGGVATFVVGATHLQQYADFIKDVPTIGTLFLLNSVGAGLICVLLATRGRVLAALGGIAISTGALISLAIAHFASGGLFDYVEPTLRRPVLISVVAEVIALLSLLAYLTIQSRASVAGRTRPSQPKSMGPAGPAGAG